MTRGSCDQVEQAETNRSLLSAHIAGAFYVVAEPLFSAFLLKRAPEAPGEYKLNASVCLKFHAASTLSYAHGYRRNVPQRTGFA